MPGTPFSFIPIWRTAPFLRVIIPLICGILASHYLAGWWQWWPFVLATVIIFFLWAHWMALSFPKLYGIALFGCWLVLGAALYRLSRFENHTDFIGKQYQKGALVAATLTTPPEPKAKSFRAEATVRQWDSATGSWKALSGKVILYFAKDSFPAGLGMGSKIAFTKTLQPIRSAGNPGGFDYQKYAADHGWFFQLYVTKDEYVVAKEKGNTGWRNWPYRARDFLLATLRRYIPNPLNLGVAEALLTGYRNDMDKELSLEYAGSGVAHIIAISGLHLGMIQAGLLVLLTPVARLRHGKNIRALIVIIFLWIFTLITGAGPSVVRSALMFTILLFGEVIGRKGNAYNSLAASAFLLLMWNPVVLFDVGFQLSYSAVLSIFMFNAPIGRWFQTGNRWLNKGWQMLVVTLSAQILTLPFVVYYFHQFPVYFLLANLLAIPLSWVALNLSLLLTIFFFWLPPVATWLGKGIDLSIAAMNSSISFINALPMSRIENIYLPLPQAILLMLVIALLSGWLLLKNKECAVWALGGLLTFIAYREWVWQHNGEQQKLIVYNIGGQTAIDIIKGHEVWFWGDTACLADPWLYRNNILPSRILHQVKKDNQLPVDTALFHQLVVGGQKIVVVDKELDTRQSGRVETDILVLADNIKAKPEWILEKVACRTIVADAKLPFYRVAQWQIAADSLHLRFHPVAVKGAFVLNLKAPDR
jgi:competence protein ComEC